MLLYYFHFKLRVIHLHLQRRSCTYERLCSSVFIVAYDVGNVNASHLLCFYRTNIFVGFQHYIYIAKIIIFSYHLSVVVFFIIVVSGSTALVESKSTDLFCEQFRDLQILPANFVFIQDEQSTFVNQS